MAKVAGGQIYQGNQYKRSVTQLSNGDSNLTQNLANRGVQEQLDRNKEQALVLYEQGLKLTASEGMESLYNQYQNDPDTLSAELNKLNEKMVSEIPDMKMKVAFRTNFLISSGSLINRAQANYDKIQYQKKKSSYFDTIQANNKSIATALSNAFNGTGSADDLVVYQRAIKQNLGLINARNDDGTYIFTDAQRLSMSNAVDKLASQSFAASLSDMDDERRNQVLEALNNDSMVILQGEQDGKVKQLNLKDAFSPDVYADMKRSAKNMDYKIKSQQLKEFNLNKRYSYMQQILHPSNENYKIWEFYHPDASKEQKEKMQASIKDMMPGYDVITTYDDYSEAFEDVKNLGTMVDDDIETNKVFEKATDIVAKIRRSKEVYEDGEKYGLNENDRNKLEEIIARKLQDPLFNELITDLPNMDAFKYIRESISGRMEGLSNISEEPLPNELSAEGIKQRMSELSARKQKLSNITDMDKIKAAKYERINQIGIDTITQTLGVVGGAKNIDNPDLLKQVKKDAKNLWEKQLLKAYAVKYDNIPDLKQDLIKNETIVNINGLLYKYIGFSNNKPQFEELRKGK